MVQMMMWRLVVFRAVQAHTLTLLDLLYVLIVEQESHLRLAHQRATRVPKVSSELQTVRMHVPNVQRVNMQMQLDQKAVPIVLVDLHLQKELQLVTCVPKVSSELQTVRMHVPNAQLVRKPVLLDQ